ncbi:M23/M56 family metallopeptidase [Lysobacter sp. CA199]|uniref:M23/M56 family metallopeptidase n=1 Tax=Lysobacter sp. CA199 TaxID=3455608 RepID=UPI003F8D45A7
MTLPTPSAWALHAAACLLAGLLAWAVGVGLHRGLRLSHAARGYWLGVWALAAVPAVLAIAWQCAAPAQAAWPLPVALPLPAIDELAGMATGASQAMRTPAANLWIWLGPALAALYLSGAAIASLRWARGALAVGRIVRASVACDPGSLPGPLSAAVYRRLRGRGVSLRVSALPISPFAVAWPRRAIVLPSALLARLSDRQLKMVLRHEAAHLAQHDPQRAASMRLVATVFWFNPFLGWIADRVQLAAELRCDAAAMGAGIGARHGYARAYLETVRLSAAAPMPAQVAAFTRRDPGNHKLRIGHMLQGDTRRRMPAPLRLALSALALLAGSAFAAVQLGATQRSVPDASPAVSAIVQAKAAGDEISLDSVDAATPARTIDWRFPVAQPRIISAYGALGGPYVRPHRGLDFAAKRGTPVYAPADATVVAATERYPGGAQYGKVVVLDHGGGWQSLYAHLDGFDVTVGQHVSVGTQIGRAGRSGKVTGPHLHVEMLFDGHRVDPQTLLR